MAGYAASKQGPARRRSIPADGPAAMPDKKMGLEDAEHTAGPLEEN